MTGNEREIDWNYNKLAAATTASTNAATAAAAAATTATAVTTSIPATAAQYKSCFLALF